MTITSRHLWLLPVIAAIGVGTGILLAPSHSLRPDDHLAAPTNIPDVIRTALHKRMERHGNDMVDLSWSVVLLKYDLVARLARHIADEANVARPINEVDTPVNAALPARFFEIQDQLIAATKQLEAIANARDPERLARTYSSVAHTCVACHALYLAPAAPTAKQ